MGAKRAPRPNIGVPAKDNSPKGDIEVTSTSSSQEVLTDTVDCNKRYNLREKKKTRDMGSASLLDSTEPGLKPYYCCT